MSDWTPALTEENDQHENEFVAGKPASAQNPFDTSAMTAILKRVANSSNVIPTLPVGDNDKAGVNGWNAKSAYNYDDFADQKSAAKAGEEVAVNDDKPAWAASAAKYEWRDEYGDIGPRFEMLEQQLFHGADKQHAGDNMAALKGIEVLQEGTRRPNPFWDFDDAGLHPVMRQNIELAHYHRPTPIQAYTIPAILQGFDIVACSQTGSGKTAAFLIPVLSRLMGKARKLAAPRPPPTASPEEIRSFRGEPLVLIVAPTRELAVQIFNEARRFCYRSMLRPAVVYGGAPLPEQRLELKKGCDVLIGTPGRICDFMDQPHVLSLNRLKYTIIDEADEMLDDSWEPQLKKIMGGGDTNDDSDHTFMMFSATFPKGARKLAREYMASDHVRIRVGRPGSTHLNVTQQIVWVNQEAKYQALWDLLCDAPPARTMIFVNDKRSADRVDDFLFNQNLPSTSIHADRTQREREDAIRSFRSGRCPIMVSTGVSARGLDVPNIMHVINFDLPRSDHGGIDEYIHRIGRTARIGHNGLATSFYNDRNEDLGLVLVKTLMETNQEVPDFLEQFKPEDDKLDFEDDSDVEEDTTEDIAAPAGDASEAPQAAAW